MSQTFPIMMHTKATEKFPHFNIAKLFGLFLDFFLKDDEGICVHVSPFCALIDDFSTVSA